ncbi:MAG: hypothetical protein IPL28_21865 [Chloroflexi bacterium]|nr:hypothetical protein [Chloroflexota bacterium]
MKFLIKIRTEWENTNESLVELINILAERTELNWVSDRKLSDLLKLLDNHLIALAEESGQEADVWLQTRLTDVIDLLVQATIIEDDDLTFIKDVIRARAQFVIKHIPKHQRRQDYLLGLPFEDCEKIRAKQEDLLCWYQECESIFAEHGESGISNLIKLLGFVKELSICQSQRKTQKMQELPLLGYTESNLWKGWLEGEDTKLVASMFQQMRPEADFGEYRESMLEGSLAWGLSAICKFLEELAQEENMRLSTDLGFLPSLVKYGAPVKLSCYLMRFISSRDVAIKIANKYVEKLKSGVVLESNSIQSEKNMRKMQ